MAEIRLKPFVPAGSQGVASQMVALTLPPSPMASSHDGRGVKNTDVLGGL